MRLHQLDLEALLNTRTGDSTIPLESDDLELLRSKMKDVANNIVTPEEYAQSAENIYKRYGIVDTTNSIFNQSLASKMISKLNEGEDMYDYLRDSIENNTIEYYKQAVYNKVNANLTDQDVNRLVLYQTVFKK